MDSIYEKRLIERGIKPTAVRILIFKVMLEQNKAFACTD